MCDYALFSHFLGSRWPRRIESRPTSFNSLIKQRRQE
jgi:hypothetical protein